jgi:selenide,water dikinase
LPQITDPNVLVGFSTADDASVYRINSELAIIQSLDFFTPIVDDAYWFGAIAAANSISDIYAMGGKPAFAQNIVAFPRANEDVPFSVLNDILRGGAEKAKEAGIAVVGGHSVDDREPKYGMCVTGFVHPDQVWKNIGAQPGDKLVLTKPIGTGVITTALRAGKVAEAVVQAAVETMAMLNRTAAETAAPYSPRACTDITGFGLLGHLLEMLGKTGAARIVVSAVPRLPGSRECAAGGSIPGGTRRNHQYLLPRIDFDARVDEVDQLLLCDAQTSGGLLFAVEPAASNDLLLALEQAKVTAALIGEITHGPTGRIRVVQD